MRRPWQQRRDAGIGLALVAHAQRDHAPHTRPRWVQGGLALEAAQQPAPGWRIELRLGTLRDHPARLDRSSWEGALEHLLAERWALRFEVSGEDRSQSQQLVALRWKVWPDEVFVKLSHSWSKAETRARQGSLTVGWEF